MLELHGQLDARDPAGALLELVERLRGLERELTEAELDATRRSELARYVNAMRSEWAMAQEVVGQLQAGRTPDAVYEWPRQLRAWSLPRIREVAGRWLSGRAAFDRGQQRSTQPGWQAGLSRDGAQPTLDAEQPGQMTQRQKHWRRPPL